MRVSRLARSAELGLTLGQLVHQRDVDDAALLGIVVSLQRPDDDPGNRRPFSLVAQLLDAIGVIGDDGELRRGMAAVFSPCSHTVNRESPTLPGFRGERAANYVSDQFAPPLPFLQDIRCTDPNVAALEPARAVIDSPT